MNRGLASPPPRIHRSRARRPRTAPPLDMRTTTPTRRPTISTCAASSVARGSGRPMCFTTSAAAWAGSSAWQRVSAWPESVGIELNPALAAVARPQRGAPARPARASGSPRHGRRHGRSRRWHGVLLVQPLRRGHAARGAGKHRTLSRRAPARRAFHLRQPATCRRVFPRDLVGVLRYDANISRIDGSVLPASTLIVAHDPASQQARVLRHLCHRRVDAGIDRW